MTPGTEQDMQVGSDSDEKMHDEGMTEAVEASPPDQKTNLLGITSMRAILFKKLKVARSMESLSGIACCILE